MTTMYFRPGATIWNAAGSWSNSSGGASNGSIPGSGDAVIFDANSGAGRTVDVGSGALCGGINTSGWAGDFTSSSGGNLTAVGNVNLASVTGMLNPLVLLGTGTLNIPFAMSGGVSVQGASGTTTLANSLVLLGSAGLAVAAGTFDAAGFSVFCSGAGGVNAAGSSVLKMGSGTWSLGRADWLVQDPATVLAGTSTLQFSRTSGGAQIITDTSSANNVYNSIVNSCMGAGYLATGSYIQTNSLQLNPSSNLRIQSGAQLAANSISAAGTAISPITIGAVSASVAGLGKIGGGKVYVDYCNISYCAASPGNTFFARNSVDAGNNTSWKFLPPNANFLTFF